MHPTNHSEPSGVDPESAHSEDGASYLRRLRNGTGEDPKGVSSAHRPPSALPEAQPEQNEKRRSVRYRCSGSAEFRAEGSDVRVWGTLTDLSLNGCYIEMSSTFPVDTRASMVLEAKGIRVLLQGEVRVSYPFLGMGIAFTEIEPGQQIQLELLLASLAGAESGAPQPSELMFETELQAALNRADAKAVLDDIFRFFANNRVLSREEFALMAKRTNRF